MKWPKLCPNKKPPKFLLEGHREIIERVIFFKRNLEPAYLSHFLQDANKVYLALAVVK